MLQVKSFDLMDEKGINDTLLKFRIAPGASIFVSEGKICIPVEDGLPTSKAHKRIAILEEKYDQERKLETILHDQRYQQIKLEGANTQLAELRKKLEEAPMPSGKKTKEIYKENKTLEDKIGILEGVIRQTQGSILMNQAEITRFVDQLRVYDERVAELDREAGE